MRSVISRVAVFIAGVLAVAAFLVGIWWLWAASAVAVVIAVAATLLVSGQTSAPAEAAQAASVAQAAADPPAVAVADAPVQPSGVPLDQVSVQSRAPGPFTIRTPFSVQPEVVLDELLQSAALVAPVKGVHLWLHDRSAHTLRLVAARGVAPRSEAPVAEDDPVIGAAGEGGAAVLRAVERAADGEGAVTLWRYAVPVGTGDGRGVVALDLSVSGGDGPPDSEALNRVTADLRAPLAAALAVQVATTELETARVLVAAASDLAAGEEPNDVLRHALQHAVEVAHADTASIMLADAEGALLRIAVAQGLPEEVVGGTTMRAGEGIAGWVYASGSPLLVEDLPGRPSSGRHGVVSSVSVPIGESGHPVGVLNVGSRTFPARLTEAYVRALGILGEQTAVGLSAARRRTRSAEAMLTNLRALVAALEERAGEIGASAQGAVLATAIGKRLGMTAPDLRDLEIAALLHDLGLWISAISPTSVSASRGTPGVEAGERSEVAAEVMERVPALRDAAPLLQHHHEPYDGLGYETGLHGEAIPLGSRIIAVTDAFLSLTRESPEGQTLDSHQAMDGLVARSGSQFDPEVVGELRKLLDEDPELVLGTR